MNLAAGAYRYRPLREGLVGWDVWALQAALGGLVRDGDFGAKTTSAVLVFQRARFTDLDDHDGIAGVKTQIALAKQMIWPVQKDQATPSGLLRGLVEGESGFWLGNHTAPYPNGTRDLGVCMFNRNPTAENLAWAFDGRKAIAETARRWVLRRDYYLPMAGANGSERLAGRYAVLHHNWPAAADRFADKTIGSWTYTSRGESYRMSDPAPWIRELGVSGVETGYAWCTHYVSGKVAYCSALR